MLCVKYSYIYLLETFSGLQCIMSSTNVACYACNQANPHIHEEELPSSSSEELMKFWLSMVYLCLLSTSSFLKQNNKIQSDRHNWPTYQWIRHKNSSKFSINKNYDLIDLLSQYIIMLFAFCRNWFSLLYPLK